MATGFIFEGRDKTQRTGNEKIAMRNVRRCFDWIIGGYVNAVEDGEYEDIPERKALDNIIYDNAMANLYTGNAEVCDRAPREMRFATERFLRAYIGWLLENDICIDWIYDNLKRATA